MQEDILQKLFLYINLEYKILVENFKSEPKFFIIHEDYLKLPDPSC